MAAPIYTTDLTTIAIGSITVDAGTWDESTHADWDTGGSMVDDANLYYNGVACVSAQMTKDSNGSGATGPATIMYVHTAAFTIPTDGAALIHHLWAAPPALNTLANAGIIVLAGTTLGDFFGWNASGSDFAPAPKGGWANYAINPGIGSPDHTVGTVTTYNMIGMAVAATAQARGNPNACNAVRYGRCESIFTDGDIANGYATFLGFATIDNISTNRWSLIDPIEGGYKWQGLMSIGTTATSVDFRDANRNINVANTINVTANFNKIEINNVNSNVEWTAINISSLGTVSKGKFEVIDNATILMTSCTFTDLDTFIYQSNSTINNSTFRRCNTVTTGGATFSGCTFDNSIAISAVSAATIAQAALISDTTFNSDGTGHAMEISGTAGDFTLTNVSFSGYASSNGSTGNEAVYINIASGTVNLTISGGDSPSIRTAGATVNVIANAVPLTITVLDDEDSSVIEGAAVTIRVADGTGPYPYQESVTITQTAGTATVSHTGHGLSTNQKVEIKGANENNYNRIKTITVIDVDSYTYPIDSGTVSPATGTITSTAIIIDGETNVSGVISDTRVYSSNQPVSGLVQRGTKQPIYKARNYGDIIDKDTGKNSPVRLTKD